MFFNKNVNKIENEAKEQKGGFFSMLLGTSDASLLGNLITGKGAIRETNQICSPLKTSQSINAELSTCDRNNKGIYSCFYESKKLFGSLM